MQIAVCLSVLNDRTFLVSARKVPQEVDLRGAELLAPASKAALLGISRPALSKALEQLNLKPVPGKNVPIFAGQFSALHIGRAGRAAAPAIVCPDIL